MHWHILTLLDGVKTSLAQTVLLSFRSLWEHHCCSVSGQPKWIHYILYSVHYGLLLCVTCQRSLVFTTSPPVRKWNKMGQILRLSLPGAVLLDWATASQLVVSVLHFPNCASRKWVTVLQRVSLWTVLLMPTLNSSQKKDISNWEKTAQCLNIYIHYVTMHILLWVNMINIKA